MTWWLRLSANPGVGGDARPALTSLRALAEPSNGTSSFRTALVHSPTAVELYRVFLERGLPAHVFVCWSAGRTGAEHGGGDTNGSRKGTKRASNRSSWPPGSSCSTSNWRPACSGSASISPRPAQVLTSTPSAGLPSRSLEILDEHEKLIDGRYTLEVSSPGLERPLRTPSHFRRYRRHDRQRAHQGRRRRRASGAGPLDAADESGIDVAGRRLTYGEIDRARTVFEWGSPAPKHHRPEVQIEQSPRPSRSDASRR